MTRDRLLAPVVALIAAAWCEMAAAAAPHLVTDINAQYITVSSYPTDFADQGAWSFIDANDGIDGFQPWISNGTASGTFLWGHVSAPGTGVTGLQPIRAGALSYILYQDPLSQATTIWVTDGTKAGSHSLTALSAASAGVDAGFIGSIGNNAALTFFNLATNARDLWVTDGTDTGTRRIQSASGAAFGVEASVSVNGELSMELRISRPPARQGDDNCGAPTAPPPPLRPLPRLRWDHFNSPSDRTCILFITTERPVTNYGCSTMSVRWPTATMAEALPPVHRSQLVC